MAGRKRRHSPDEILAILQEHSGSVTAKEVIHRHGISLDTLFRWKRKYGGVDRADPHRLKALEEENRRLNRVVVDQASPGAEGRAGKGLVTASQPRTQRPLSERQACRYLGIHRAPIRSRSRREPPVALLVRLCELAALKVRWGSPPPHLAASAAVWLRRLPITWRE